MQLGCEHVAETGESGKITGSVCAAYVLLIAFCVRRSGIKRSETAALPTEYLFSRFLVDVESGGKVFLLLFYVLEGLIDVILFISGYST